jgi:hypothetical protein
MRIKSVLICYRHDQYDIFYEVGRTGVTQIVRKERHGEMAMISIYEVYKENILIATVERPDVITYFEE